MAQPLAKTSSWMSALPVDGIGLKLALALALAAVIARILSTVAVPG